MNGSYLITFRSITYAQKGERLLKEMGIPCTLQRTPKALTRQGCGYCLRLSLRDGAKAAELLRQKQVQMRKIYLQMEGGDIQEVQL